MNDFIRVGETMLLAYEGEQQIARALVAKLNRGISWLLQRITRAMSNPSCSVS
ncbi:hypothetical protein [Rhodovastum atsumiense]|uniref:hypothetical protein n=1 Tax=Rhodovastum atsumiense TaxID=504468 RepID=UPI00139F2A51|nr:hypothetical protein [Rhodovastum atsumiense]